MQAAQADHSRARDLPERLGKLWMGRWLTLLGIKPGFEYDVWVIWGEVNGIYKSGKRSCRGQLSFHDSDTLSIQRERETGSNISPRHTHLIFTNAYTKLLSHIILSTTYTEFLLHIQSHYAVFHRLHRIQERPCQAGHHHQARSHRRSSLPARDCVRNVLHRCALCKSSQTSLIPTPHQLANVETLDIETHRQRSRPRRRRHHRGGWPLCQMA